MPNHKKPTRLKKIQGTYRADRDAGNEPEPTIEIPKCPTFLKGEARREWKRISVELEQLGLISQIDRAALAAYCSCWAQFAETEKLLQTDGLTVVTPKGHVQQRPEVSIRRAALDQMKAYLTEFGLTPASRSRISLPANKTNAANPFTTIGVN